MKKIILKLAVIGFFLLIGKPVFSANAQTNPPTPDSIVEAINQLRLEAGLTPLASDERLMGSAQEHSDYQAAINRYTYFSEDKSNVTDRAIAAGYGDGDTVVCGESIAFTSISTTIDTVLNSVWNNSKDRDLVLLNPDYEYIGAGVSRKDASLFYAVDVCMIKQLATADSSTGTVSSSQLTPEVDSGVVEVLVATPQTDGAIYHPVEAGQAVWSIAIAYNTTIENIVNLNGLSASNPQIFTGQSLLVRMANTPTVTSTFTETPVPATRTIVPSSTRKPDLATGIPTLTPSPTPGLLGPGIPSQYFDNSRSIGFILIGISALGIILIGLSVLQNRAKP